MIDYKGYAIKFCRILQQIERDSKYKISLDDIKLIRRFKTELGYSIPESIEESSGSMIRKSKVDNYIEDMLIEYSRNK